MVVARVTQDISAMQGDAKTKLAEELSKIRMVESQESTFPVNLEEEDPNEQSIRECGLADQMLLVQPSTKPAGLESSQEKGLFSVTNFSPGCNSI